MPVISKYYPLTFFLVLFIVFIYYCLPQKWQAFL
jgi:hypothetical protein